MLPNNRKSKTVSNVYTPHPDGHTILKIITGDKECDFLIDTEDVPRVRIFKWRLSPIQKYNQYHYAVSNDLGSSISLHRLVLSFPKDLMVDHLVDESDTRKIHLREVTPLGNSRNKRRSRNNQSGAHGVRARKLKTKTVYTARISVVGKRIFLGYFQTIEEAIRAREEAELLHFGLLCRK